MKLDEARELRKELETIEATMERIKDLWCSNDFPSSENLEDLARGARGVVSSMKGIEEVSSSDTFPSAVDFEDLGRAVKGIRSEMEAIIEKADELPSADDVRV
jgi:hypothetical protein